MSISQDPHCLVPPATVNAIEVALIEVQSAAGQFRHIVVPTQEQCQVLVKHISALLNAISAIALGEDYLLSRHCARLMVERNHAKDQASDARFQVLSYIPVCQSRSRETRMIRQSVEHHLKELVRAGQSFLKSLYQKPQAETKGHQPRLRPRRERPPHLRLVWDVNRDK